MFPHHLNTIRINHGYIDGFSAEGEREFPFVELESGGQPSTENGSRRTIAVHPSPRRQL